MFAPCCEGAAGASGLCIPGALLPPGAPELASQTCADGQVCAPRSLVADPNVAFVACTSPLASRGVCIEECYLPDLAQTVSLAGSCAAGQRCVDCGLLGDAIAGCAR